MAARTRSPRTHRARRERRQHQHQHQHPHHAARRASQSQSGFCAGTELTSSLLPVWAGAMTEHFAHAARTHSPAARTASASAGELLLLPFFLPSFPPASPSSCNSGAITGVSWLRAAAATDHASASHTIASLLPAGSAAPRAPLACHPWAFSRCRCPCIRPASPSVAGGRQPSQIIASADSSIAHRADSASRARS